MTEFNWLHLGDLHVGMAAQSWLWPRFEKDFLDDLSRLHDKAGPWHLLLFTGDLVRAGTVEEFAKFDDVLDTIYGRLRSLGSDPALITLPGNHDLTRPPELDAKAIALAQFADREDLQKDFWGEDGAGYRAFTNSLFSNYVNWRDKASASGRHLIPAKEGLLAGDASYVVNGIDVSAKIVTLNSTWLQTTDGEFQGRLFVDPRQFLAAVHEKPDEWLANCDFSLIATHQPTDWLAPLAQEGWRSEIYTADRFALHAFGHMHVADTKTYTRGGGGVRREFQTSSLFGLERTSAGLERIQGYAVNRFHIESGRASVRVWPRVLTSVADGEKKLKADPSQDLDEDNSYSLSIDNRSTPGTPRASAPLIESKVLDTDVSQRFRIENIEIFLSRDPGHQVVRRADQQKALNAWADKPRAFWLVSEWGLGEEAFIGSVRAGLGTGEMRCFRIGLEGFKTKGAFLESVRATHGITFEEICDRIEEQGNTILVLADAPLISPSTASCHALATEIESLVYTTRDYLEHGRFAVTARTSPASHSLPVIQLTPLDEPDIRAYVSTRRGADPSFTSAATVSRLHQVTDGHPGRLDAALKQLEVVSLNELVMSNPDLEPTQPVADVPAALPAMITGLRSEGEAGERSYSLLENLSLFPSGEQLDRIRRFDTTKPSFPAHATMLLDRHLIEAVNYSHFGEGADANSARLLVVPRPVRDYVRASSTPHERERLDRRAVELYFGKAWKEGLPKGAIAARIVRNPLAPPHELFNCNTIILRTIVRAQESGSEVDTEAAVRIAIAFLDRQVSGNHYRSALALAEDLAPILAEASEISRALVEIARADCLRMTGREREARDAYLGIETDALPKKTQQEIQLGLALSYNAADQLEERRAAAERAIKLSAGSSAALQAKALLAQMEPHGAARDEKLDRLLQKARSTKSYVVANNIKLTRAEEASSEDRRSILREIVNTARAHGDFYNGFRAIVRLAEMRSANETVSDADKSMLINAYHFFHNERVNSLFNRVHDLLWKIFEEDGDIWNLLSLFRHSSFIWRLADLSDAENEYLDALRPRHDSIMRSNLPNLGRERSYFLVRLQAVAAN